MEKAPGEAVRVQICQFVRANPGAHFRDIQRTLGLSPGQAVHHLRRLISDGLLVLRRSTRYTHYYPAGTPPGPRPALGVLRQPARRALAQRLQATGPASLRQLAEATGSATSTLHHHLRVMLDAGVLVPEGPRPVRYHLSAEALEALHVIAASPERGMPMAATKVHEAPAAPMAALPDPRPARELVAAPPA